MVDNNVTHTSAYSKACLLNEHFLSKSKLPPLEALPQLPPLQYLTDHTLNDIIITEEELKKIITGLKANSANGPDNISNRLLKEVTHSI